MDGLEERIERICWHISAKLSGGNTNAEASGVLDYLGLHTKLIDLVRFHLEYIQMQNGDPEVVYRALCFMADYMVTPFSGATNPSLWFYHNFHTLLTLTYANKSIGNEAKKFLDDLEAGIKKLRESREPNDG
jgi:hypothetical protein